MKKFKLNENLRAGELRDTVDQLIEIDRYKPKLGSDENTVVVAFKTTILDAAKDLGAFLEWSPVNVDDVEVSEASDDNGKFHVYIELKRIPGINDKIIKIVKDIEHITGPEEWKFVSMDGQRDDLTIENLNYKIIQDPKIYALPPESRDWYLRMKSLTKY